MSWKTVWTALVSLIRGTTPVPAFDPPVVPPAPPVDSGTQPDVVLKLLAMHNAARSGVNLPALALDRVLTRLAEDQAGTMARRGALSHEVGGSLGFRLDQEDYRCRTAGENIAAGYAYPSSVMQGWFNSPPHYANIVSPRFTAVGFAQERARNGTLYWCALFAAPVAVRTLRDHTVRELYSPHLLLHPQLRDAAAKEAQA